MADMQYGEPALVTDTMTAYYKSIWCYCPANVPVIQLIIFYQWGHPKIKTLRGQKTMYYKEMLSSSAATIVYK